MLKKLLALSIFALSLNVQANSAYSYNDYLTAAVQQFVQNNDEGEITLTLKFKKPQQMHYPAYRLETQQQMHYSQQWRYLPR